MITTLDYKPARVISFVQHPSPNIKALQMPGGDQGSNQSFLQVSPTLFSTV